MNAVKVIILTFGLILSLVQGDLTKPESNQWYAIFSVPSGKSLDIRTNYTAIYPFKYSATQILQFKIVNGGPGRQTEYQIAEHDNDMVISLDYDEVTVVLRRANSADSKQLWYVERKRATDVLIVNKKTKWCLDVYKDWKHQGNRVTTWKCSDYPYNQYWTLLKLC